MSYEAKIKCGIVQRLKYIQPYIDHWDEAMAWMAHPANVGFAHKTLMDFASQLLEVADDKSAHVCGA